MNARPANERRIVLWLLALGCALRLLFLNSRSLWFDETTTLYLSQLPWREIAGRVGALEENPPLHYLIMHFWEKLFADPVIAMRLFSALCGVASLPLFYRLCRKLMPKQASFALFLAAVSSFWIHFAQDGRIYGLLLLLGLAAHVLFLALEERSTPQRALAYAAICVAGLYTHNFFALLLLGHAAWLALQWRMRPSWWVLYGAVLLAYLPWLRVVLAQIDLLSRASILQEPLTIRNLCYVLGTMAFDTSFLSLMHVEWTQILGLILLLSLANACWLLRGKLGEAGRFCAVQIVVPLIGLRAIEIFSGHPATQARYLIFVSPFLYILLAWTLEQPLKGVGKYARIACAVVFASGTIGYFAGGLYVDPHLRDLAEAIRRTTGADDVVVYLDPYWYLPMRYYYLPERTNRLAGPDAKIANWEGLPGYPSYISREELVALKRCVVVDPRHLMMTGRVGLATGAQVAAVAYP